MTLYLNAGNLWSQDYLTKVIELNSKYGNTVKVKTLFGSIAKLTPTARSADRLPYLEWSQIDKFVRRAQGNSIGIRYTLNASCFGSLQDFDFTWHHKKLKEDIQELHDIGVHEWTVTSPLLMMQLREIFPDDFLEVSTIAEVSTPTDAARWQSLGADGVNISTNINRNLNAIRSIVATGIEVSILANEACLYRCPFRRECYNLSSHNSLRSEELFSFYPFRYCNEIRMKSTAEWLKARMVLPQWISVYQDYTSVDWYKIAYRTHPYEVAIPILEAYMKQIHTGNYLDLWPTISHLGATKEPKDMQYISCEKLDALGFLDKFLSGTITCEESVCGKDCRYCDVVAGQV